MKRRIVSAALAAFIIVNIAFVSKTWAWFSTTVESNDQVAYTTGKVNMRINYFMKTSGSIIVPGEDLVNPSELQIVNESTVPIRVRAYVEYSFELPGEDPEYTPTYVPLTDQNIVSNPYVNFVFDSNWQYDDGYWYYGGEPAEGMEIPINTHPKIFSNITLKDSVNDLDSDKVFRMRIECFAIQSVNVMDSDGFTPVKWLPEAEFDYSSGNRITP